MRRLWMGAAALAMLAACKSEGVRQHAQETEKTQGAQVAPQVDVRVQESAQSAEDKEAIAVGRVLGMALAVSQGEVDASKLAKERAASQEVKAYAAKLEAEHQEDIAAINRIAQSRKIDLGAAQSDVLIRARQAANKEKLDRLGQLSGAPFEQAYIDGNPGEHAALAQLAQQGQEISSDAEVKSFLQAIAAQANDHRARALAIEPKLCELSAPLPLRRHMHGQAAQIQSHQAAQAQSRKHGAQAHAAPSRPAQRSRPIAPTQ